MKLKFDKGSAIRRCYPVKDFRAATINTDGGDDGGNQISGHAAVFNSVTSIGGWWNEVIAADAFDGCNFDDVLFFVNHDSSQIPLARSRRNNSNSTMQIGVDAIGLSVDAKIDTANNQAAAALYSAISRGDISGMSFCFVVADDSWDGLDTDMPTRTIKKIAQVFEVSAVNQPAYDMTDISARDKQALENSKRANEIEVLKARNSVLSKF